MSTVTINPFCRLFSFASLLLITFALFLASNYSSRSSPDQVIRLGMIGLDTSHVIAFTRALNDPNNPEHVAGARVVAAFKGG